jgi:Tol biopolymer transport system component
VGRHAAALAVAAGALVSCGRGGEAPEASRALAAPRDGEGSGFELVYERTIGENLDLYVVPAGGGVERRLTDHPAPDALPRWSRDGRWIYFTSERSGNWQIYRVRPEGGEPERVRSNPHREWQVEPSPDGRSIAFLSNQEGPEYLFVMDLETRAERVLVRHGNSSILGNPSWSPSADRLTFSSNWKIGHQIYLFDLAKGEERRLTQFRAGGCEPRFHPGGRHVMHVSRGHLSEKSRLVEKDLASGEQTVLVDWPALNYTPAYAPDASEIAFTSNITGDWVIYRQRRSDGKSWRVTHGPGPARAPDYAPAARR